VTKQRHVREGDGLDDDEIIVIRGGGLVAAALRVDAQRYHDIYGEYGISVFAARDATVDELAHQVPLVRFETRTLVRAEICAPPGSDSTRPAGTPAPHRRVRRARIRCRSAHFLRAPQLVHPYREG
jgi:hypothetical protein